MKRRLTKLKSKAMFVIVGGAIVINPAYAQDAQAQGAQTPDEATTLDRIVVSGLRNSLEQSMGIKRDSAGVVDAISAEDIGKFPDTNLAESLQRITGISIERRDGEGAQVTARGFGPQFNMVTLNGRQIPGADAFGAPGQVPIGGVDGGTRAFNFAQLASEAISSLEVYKTGQANVPSGGIGATINIQTDRPFNHTGIVASAGVKAVSDESQPFDSEITPEVSGIFSYTNADKTFGVGLSASYQKRHGGSVQATENAWNIQPWTGTEAALRPGATVTNAPQIGQLYGMPNDLRYAFADFERERINGQAVLQFAPTDSVTLTLDYTYSTNEISEDRGEQGIWLQRANSFTHLEFDTGQEVATPVYLRDIVGAKDFGFEQQRNEQKYKLDSIGLNAVWNVSDRFSLAFDAHNTKSSSRPNDPLTGGGSTYFSFAGTNNCETGPYCGGNWAQELWFNNGLPIGARTWYPTAADAVAGTNGVVNPDFPPEQLGSQVLRINAQTQVTEIKQGRIDGTWDFDDGRFQFGVDSSRMTMRRRQATEMYAALGDWSVANAGEEPGMVDLLTPVSIIGLFDDWSTAGAAPGAWRGNANALAQWAAAQYGVSTRVNPQLAADNRIEEDTDAIYLQVELQGELGGMPTNTRVGVRYERTDVVSTSAVAIPSAIEWQANNDFRIIRSEEVQPFSEKADYSYVLPNLDFSIDITDELKGRASFSKTIARPPYGNLYAGPNPNQPTGSILVNPSTRADGDAQNPGLEPLESDNLDLALEWYFADASYVSVTFWNKSVDNFIGTTVVRENLYGLTDPTSGPDAQAALAFLQSQACVSQVTAAGGDVEAGCSANDTALFTALAMYRNEAATGGLAAYNGTDTQVLAMENAYDLYGEADDPLYLFDVERPINQNKAKLRGWEIGGQYFFGDSGFGVFANYTVVNGDVGFDNASLADQFALLGLSDTANVMLMYEKHGWSARLAWNWRDEYLILANQNGSNRNPHYVEEYEQWDLSVNYAFNDHWSVGLEAINLTGEDVRWHGRSEKQIIRLIDQSPRYMLGVRYRF
ncbi:TonB-dependent receptor [Vulcaniibacterium tengchongense]|uniref:TonB-dependent receptor n=1 Tax=Vulcaniibacterium tengchongense TaxID=1273429 RepID=A0A3N4VFN3_9GAMM|nr:TonB-dependent receptor [Vulcaniibacterium tengchongense]RPE81866.1 TonB-dependent receptor [Vulcaniibacterium tengchongense]